MTGFSENSCESAKIANSLPKGNLEGVRSSEV